MNGISALLRGIPVFGACMIATTFVGCFSTQPQPATSSSDTSEALAAKQLQPPTSGDTELQKMTNSIGMKLVLIPKGSFQMGSPSDEPGRDADEPLHEVTISRDYYLGITEVTQAQYEKVMGAHSSHFQVNETRGDSSNHPVEMVSWDDAVDFCERLSALPEERASGRVYRLPTEAEWEYACRAGSTTTFGFGNGSVELEDFAWFRDNSGRTPVDSKQLWLQSGQDADRYSRQLAANDPSTHAAALKTPNTWGLYDMHGNVAEWCLDWYAHYEVGPVVDPIGPSEGRGRVRRGGGWSSDAERCRAAYRRQFPPTARDTDSGFRVALSPPRISKEAIND